MTLLPTVFSKYILQTLQTIPRHHIILLQGGFPSAFRIPAKLSYSFLARSLSRGKINLLLRLLSNRNTRPKRKMNQVMKERNRESVEAKPPTDKR
jgi:hypothetical protein